MKYIVTDKNGKPMRWSVDQLCYCEDEFWEDEPFPIKIYTEKYARFLIRKSIQYRQSNNFGDNDYKLMPIVSQ